MPSPTGRAREVGCATVAVLGACGALVALATALPGVTRVLGPWSFADAPVTSSWGPVGEASSGEVPAARPAAGPHDLATGTPTSIALSAGSGTSGTRVRLSGEGFGAGEAVVIRFDAQRVARATADGQGNLAGVVVAVPADVGAFAPASFEITATGAASSRSADATFDLTS